MGDSEDPTRRGFSLRPLAILADSGPSPPRLPTGCPMPGHLLTAVALLALGWADPDAQRRAAMNSGGNPARGKALFASDVTKCSACHKVRGRGGEVGPDLSQVAGKLDRTHLIESILDPSAQV